VHEIILTDDHRYLVNGTPKIGVTKVLDLSGLSSYYPRDPWYLERGRMVHLGTALIDSDTLDWLTVDERIKGYLEGYQKFLHETGWKFQYSEVELYDPIYDFCGKPDRFLPLTDIKTGEDNEEQLGGYWQLLQANGYNPKREAYTLKLNENGTYKLLPPKEKITVLRDIFLAGLTLIRWKERKYGNIHNVT
jgi:hypothetical protein